MLTPVGSERRVGFRLAPLVVVVLCWELAARGALIDPSFYPPPTLILETAVELFRDGEMTHHVVVSLRRVVLSLCLGGSAGVAAGLLMGWSKPVRYLLNPYVALLYPVPKIVLLPIMFAVFGITELARVLTLSLAVFLIVAMSTVGAVRELNEVYVDIAIDNGASRFDIFREVIVPGTLPQIVTGLSLGFGLAFILIVVVEFVAASAGLGYVIWSSWQLYTIPRMYVALLLINVVGIIFLYGIEALGNVLTPWEQQP